MTHNNQTKMAMISEVCRHGGPFLSVYLDVSRDMDEAPHRLAVRWRSAREQLLRLGAPEDLVDDVGERMQDPTGASGKAARMIVATADEGVIMDDVITRPKSGEVLAWGPLPDLVGWLGDRLEMRPVLVVLADREGADFELYDAWPEKPVTTDSFHGDTEHLRKVAVGGWAHKQYQRRAEWTWRRNAEEVAAEIDRQVQSGVPVVAVAGDLRAQGEIRNAVSERTRSLLVELDTGGRAAGASREPLDHSIEKTIHGIVTAEHQQLIDELEAETGRAGLAATGIADVVPRFAQGQIRTALLVPREAANHTVDLRDHPGLPLASDAYKQGSARADLVVLCCAAATDAEVVMVPEVPSDDGVAAVLRWTDEPQSP